MRRVLSPVLLLLAASTAVSAQSAPLSRAEILGRLAQGHSPSYVAQLVKVRGVSFAPRADFLEHVKLAGGEGVLIERLSASAPSAGSSLAAPDRPTDSLAKCAELIHKGAAVLAEKDCRAAIDENPESGWPITAALRALAVSGTATSEERIELLRRAVSLDPTLVSAHRALAVSDVPPEERAKEMQAVAALEQAQPPEDSEAGAFTSDVSLASGNEVSDSASDNRTELLARARAAVQERPDLAMIRLNAAFAYLSLGDKDNVASEIRAALRLEPDNAELHVALASLFLAENDTDSELNEYREAVRIAPYENAYRRRFTDALLRKKRSEEAIREWRDFLQLAPLDLAASSSLVNLYLAQKERDSAIAELRRSLKASSDASVSEAVFIEERWRDVDRLARLLTENREFDEAAHQYDLLLRFRADDAVLHNNLGSVLSAQGRCEEASGEFRDALRLQPDLSGAHHNLADCLLVAKRTEDAIAEYRQSVELDPDKAESRISLGVALTAKGELNSAIEQFQLVLAEEPANAPALAGLAEALLLNGKPGEGLDAEEKAAKLAADDPQIQSRLQHFREAAQLAATANPDPQALR